ncbi:uncharacterized protein LOC135222327 [Macrobrachium nipponense]|uniref:uncharacterized protein LOC135222327 n=1 Tax=Macrobrachium nipponense TaxID=159736 RepID=UPI0030C82912
MQEGTPVDQCQLHSDTWLSGPHLCEEMALPMLIVGILQLTLLQKAGSQDFPDKIRVFSMQLDMWAPPRDDVLIRYNLTNHFKPGDVSEFPEVTVCIRAKPVVLMSYESHISIATSDQDNDVLHMYRRGMNHGFYYNGVRQYGFINMTNDIGLHEWTHYCHNFHHGEYRAYIYGELAAKGPFSVPHKVPLPVKGIITIGQEQDLMAGGYDTDQSFRGYIAQVNIWNRSLTADEVRKQASCTRAELGNIFSTDREDVELLGGTTMQLVDPSYFCEKNVEYVIFPEARYMAESRRTCNRIGYEVYTPNNFDENAQLHNESLRFAENCLSNYHLWIGVTDEEVEDVWRKFTDNSIAQTQFELNEPNGGDGENCMLMFLPNGRWVDTSCVIQWPACVPCEVNRKAPLRLRGFCFTNEAETFYEVLAYRYEKPYLHGYYGYMVYKIDDYTWEMFDTTVAEVVGILKVPSKDTYPIGRHTWELRRSECNNLIGSRLQLSFSICNNNEFTCSNGDCIPKEKRCNAKDDCVDLSDEEDCQVIIHPKGYRRERPPDNITHDGQPVHLSAVVNVLRFMEINDKSRIINVEFTVDLSWNDPRVKYHNLGDTLEWNKLSETYRDSIWKPVLTFPNVYDGQIKKLAFDMYLDKLADPLPPDYNNVRMDTAYAGTSADIVQKEHYSGVFGCSFDVVYYPFDSQRCFLLLQLSTRRELIKFHPQRTRVLYLEDPKLPAYLLSRYQIDVIVGGNNETQYSSLKVTFELTRRWRMIILTVYLPTTMLQIIGYTTLFVNVVLMDVRMGVSLTTLLVLYTLFSSTSDALPVTAYVKLIDVWFFFCIFFMFFIIVVHVVVEHMVNLAEEKQYKQVLPFDYRRTVEKSVRPTSESAEKLMYYARYVITPGVILFFNFIYWGLVFGTSFKE